MVVGGDVNQPDHVYVCAWICCEEFRCEGEGDSAERLENKIIDKGIHDRRSQKCPDEAKKHTNQIAMQIWKSVDKSVGSVSKSGFWRCVQGVYIEIIHIYYSFNTHHSIHSFILWMPEHN